MTCVTEHIQLIWDRECAGTAQTQAGSSIQVGPYGEWTPEQLLVIAVEASLMTTFLQLAADAGLQILGYVSAAEADLTFVAGAQPSLVVRPCIVVASDRDRRLVQRLLARAAERSPVARALKDAVQVDPEVVTVPPVGAA
jgi:organic hydroperoxide reductase OsmC/OhrA